MVNLEWWKPASSQHTVLTSLTQEHCNATSARNTRTYWCTLLATASHKLKSKGPFRLVDSTVCYEGSFVTVGRKRWQYVCNCHRCSVSPWTDDVHALPTPTELADALPTLADATAHDTVQIADARKVTGSHLNLQAATYKLIKQVRQQDKPAIRWGYRRVTYIFRKPSSSWR